MHCIRVTAAGSRVTVRSFDVTPGQSSVFLLNGLPLGPVAFGGDAFPVACSSVMAGDPPNWESETVTETLVAGVVANVGLTMRRNGQASVNVDFEDEGTCTNGVQDGTESDVDCGGACSPCADGHACNVGSDCQNGTVHERHLSDRYVQRWHRERVRDGRGLRGPSASAAAWVRHA